MFRFWRRRFYSLCFHKPRYIIYALILVVIIVTSVNQKKLRGVYDVEYFRQMRFVEYQKSEISRIGIGEKGAAVHLSKNDIFKYKNINEKEGFNYGASELVALDRSLIDLRPQECKNRVYDLDLPMASVVIVYHNEAFTVVMRTVHSVINRTPPRYLEEVVLLDDSSTREELLEPLQTYIRQTWPDGIVRVVRTPERYGLIRAKLYGANKATGPVLVFLDAHCEVTKGWIEPVLHDIKEDPTRIICPSMRDISYKTLKFSSFGGNQRGGFSWTLAFTWQPRSAHERATTRRGYAFPSPTMAGGLFAADKSFFFRIGAYDDKMEIWGGENIDLSFRTWMCHGSLLFHPCSIVGHIFRPTHPYGFPSKTRDYMNLNSKRVADVWMDDYKRYYYWTGPHIKSLDIGDLSERHAIRKRENCHSFRWYLDNVYPEKFRIDENVTVWGSLRNPSTKLCLDAMSQDGKANFSPGLFFCHETLDGLNQIFSMTPEGQIRREKTCMTVSMKDRTVRMTTTCNTRDRLQQWTYDKESQLVKNVKTGKCLDISNFEIRKPPALKLCNQNNSWQKWDWITFT